MKPILQLIGVIAIMAVNIFVPTPFLPQWADKLFIATLAFLIGLNTMPWLRKNSPEE
jgi:hypothetical protein